MEDVGGKGNDSDFAGEVEKFRGDMRRSFYTIEHMLKTEMWGLAIYDRLPDSLRRDLPRGYRDMLSYALMRHDCSKTKKDGWSNELLLGERRPTRYEWLHVIKPHPEKAASKVENGLQMNNEDHFIIAAIFEIIELHHERYDGATFFDVGPDGRTDPPYAGYPGRLQGEAIPLGARIAKLADAVCAMDDERVYRHDVLNMPDIIEQVNNAGRVGKEYCPIVVAAFNRIPTELCTQISKTEIWDEEATSDIKRHMAMGMP